MRSAGCTVLRRCAITIRVTLSGKRITHHRLGTIVECAGRLVEQQNARRCTSARAIMSRCPARLTACRNASGPGVHAHRHRLDVLVDPGKPRGFPRLLHRRCVRRRCSRRYCRAQRAFCSTTPICRRNDAMSRVAIGGRRRRWRPESGCSKTEQQPEQGRLAASRRADDGEILALAQAGADIVEDRWPARLVTERHVGKLDCTRRDRQALCDPRRVRVADRFQTVDPRHPDDRELADRGGPLADRSQARDRRRQRRPGSAPRS